VVTGFGAYATGIRPRPPADPRHAYRSRLSALAGSRRKPAPVADFALESVRQLEQADALPDAVAFAGGGFAKDFGLLQAIERTPTGLVAEAGDRLRRREGQHRMSREGFDQPPRSGSGTRPSCGLKPPIGEFLDLAGQKLGAVGRSDQRAAEEVDPVVARRVAIGGEAAHVAVGIARQDQA
jgi:hypothetical protein